MKRNQKIFLNFGGELTRVPHFSVLLSVAAEPAWDMLCAEPAGALGRTRSVMLGVDTALASELRSAVVLTA